MKLMLASFDNGNIIDWELARNSKYILCSYFYLKSKSIKKQLIDLIIERNDTRDFLLDSGAFTLFSSSSLKVDFEKYLYEYIEFINKYDIHDFIELDIDAVVGYQEVLKYRSILEKETGKKCVPVWHKSRGIEAYKEIVNDYDYICIGGLGNKEIKPNEYRKVKNMVNYANTKGTRVHGLAFTRQDAYAYGFYSVDSSSWTMGERFGSAFLFDGRNLKSLSRPKNKKGNRKKLHRNNLRSWIQYQHYIDKIGVNN